MAQAATEQSDDIGANAETLLRQTLTECGHAVDRVRDLLQLAEALVAVIPPDRRIEYLELIARYRTGTKAGRGEAVNENIVEFAFKKPRVTATEVREALTGKGLSVDQKQVANSLDYLTRRGQMERIGRGEYRINPAAEAEIDRMLTEKYGPGTFRGLPPGMDREPNCY